MDKQKRLHIGVDVGGTFTDVVAVDADGQVLRAKASTTPGHHVDGIIDALSALARRKQTSLTKLMADTEFVSVGTTVVTNAVAELRGRRVGLLVTKGFRDTLLIARSPRVPTVDPFVQQAMPTLVPRAQIAEINERVDASGKIVVALDVAEVVAQVGQLKAEQDVEAIAICYLWSFLNPSHETATKDALAAAFPDLFVTASSDLYPVIREYERMVTTCLNAFVSEAVSSYSRELDHRLRDAGFTGRAYLGQSLGGVLDPEEAAIRPLHLFNSGPVGGVTGARRLAQELGIDEFITGDMGGTSYDVALVRNQSADVTHRAVIDRFETGLSQLDITTVGAGGGSICWIDERGAPRVGPRSAGARPGPVCYGRGGEEPTITDIAVVLGLIEQKHFLGGEMPLATEAARAAVAEKLKGLGDSPEDIAREMHRIIVSSMIQVVRGVSVSRGRDPRGLAMISFGGAAALFAAEICRGVGIPRLLIPEYASVFSAVGLISADPIRTEARSVHWSPESGPLATLNDVLNDLTYRATANMRARGFADAKIALEYSADMRFSGQSFDVSVPLASSQLEEGDRGALIGSFQHVYSTLYGPGSVWAGFPPMVTTVRVVARGQRDKPPLERRAVGHTQVPPESRNVFVAEPGSWRPVPVYTTRGMRPDDPYAGPRIVENSDTTIYVPPDCTVSRGGKIPAFEITLS